MVRASTGSLVVTDRLSLTRQEKIAVHGNQAYAGRKVGLGAPRQKTPTIKSHSFLGLIVLVCLLYSYLIMSSTNSVMKLAGRPIPPNDEGPQPQQKERRQIHSRLKGTARNTARGTTESSPATTVPAPQHQLVFSTGCSQSQDWQSYVFFYHALMVQQQGRVTRIASGCTPEQQTTLRSFHDRAVRSMSPNFHLHFTPDYSEIKNGVKYVYFNKPYGLRHWMERELGYPENRKHDDDIVVVLDPDQILMRPFTNNFSNATEVWNEGAYEAAPQSGQPLRVKHGQPFAQLYGFVNQWKTHVNLSHVLDDKAEQSNVHRVTKKQALENYPAGPPYVATARDMYHISVVWSDFVVRVHDSYPHLLAEMFAYSLAVAHLNLPHRLSRSFMLSNVEDAIAEAWHELVVDDISDADACRNVPTDRLPYVLHYCQRYRIGLWKFEKHNWDGAMLSTCEAPLFEEPFANLTDYDYWTDGEQRVNLTTGQGRKQPGKLQGDELKRGLAFMLCSIIHKMNQAAAYFKHTQCHNEAANFDKTVRQGA